jgi:hypothetical protein
MLDNSPIALRKPTMFRPVQVNGQALFKAIGKGVVDAGFGNWNNVGLDVFDALDALGVAKKPEELAWMLIYRSLIRAMLNLMESNQSLLAECPRSARAIDADWANHLEAALAAMELKVDADFFRAPKRLEILETIQTPFGRWLETFGLSEAQANAMSARLPSYFVAALHKEWVAKSEYQKLQEETDSPFMPALEQERAWLRYRAWLQMQVEEPMFLEAFGLKQVYVPLNCYFEQKTEKKEPDFDDRLSSRAKRRVIGDLKETLQAWLRKADRDDAIRVICGGPGCGKSSFTKIWAAELAESGEIPVLFVPLHQLNWDTDLKDAIGKFIRDDLHGVMPPNPLQPENLQSRLLLIFDGLDELAMQGKVGIEAAQQFVRDVQKLFYQFNQKELKLQVLLSGRDVVVQANNGEFRKEKQILHVLPYFANTRDSDIDEKDLLKVDLRNQWWENYGAVTGRNYSHLPNELAHGNLVEITAQPLLNYLVALSYVRGKRQISETSNLNEIYADLLEAIHERGWADKRQIPALRGVELKDFIRILEEVALAAWHGDGRTTTVREIEAHCDNSGLKKMLEVFQEGAKSGVTQLLTAFYFRQGGGHRDGDKTFEFTHKSFGEYLTARRIIRSMVRMHTQLEKREEDVDDGWDEQQALKHWAEICGPSAMDEYVFRFLCDEIRLCDLGEVKKWQKTFSRLIEEMLKRGMPMDLLGLKNYHEQRRQARNAEEALLVALNACGRLTKECAKVTWPSEEAFGAWIGRLQGQRKDGNNTLAFSCMSWLDLSQTVLDFRDLYGANLENQF